MKFNYKIDGFINNNEEVLGYGSGLLDLENGTSELNVHFDKRSAGWDPRTIVTCCCTRAFAMVATQNQGAINLLNASKGVITIGRNLQNVVRRAIIHDDAGEIVADISASSETNLNKGIDHSTIVGGFSTMYPGKTGIAEITSFSGVMMQAGPKVVNMMVKYGIVTEDNLKFNGFTFYPHFLPLQTEQLPFYQHFEVEVLDQYFEEESLFLKTRALVLPLQLHAEALSQPEGILVHS